MILMNDSVVLLLGGIKHKYKMVTKFKKGVKQKYWSKKMPSAIKVA